MEYKKLMQYFYVCAMYIIYIYYILYSSFSTINGVHVCYKTVDITNANSDSQSYVNIE